VVTLYYRPPEILMGMPYDHKTDMWSLGCIFAELVNEGKALLPGKNIEHQFELMCSKLGFPEIEDWPEVYHEQGDHIAWLAKYNFYSKNRLKDSF
jgi:serine/threonine protein kinase